MKLFYESTIIDKIDDEKYIVDWLKTTSGMNLDNLLPKIKDEKLLQELILCPKIYEFNKIKAIKVMSAKALLELVDKLPEALEDEDHLQTILVAIKQRLTSIGEKNLTRLNEILERKEKEKEKEPESEKEKEKEKLSDRMSRIKESIQKIENLMKKASK